MQKFFALFCLVAGCALPAMAVTIKDPKGLLPELGFDLRSGTWEQAVKCGERQSYYRVDIFCELKCSSWMCMNTCSPAEAGNNVFDLALEECTTDSVAIYGTNNFSGQLTRAEFEQTGTWIHALLRNIEHHLRPIDTIEIVWKRHNRVTIIENGTRRDETGIVLSAQVRPLPNSAFQEYDFVFLPGQSLLNSLVYFGPMGPQDYFLKKKGVAGVR